MNGMRLGQRRRSLTVGAWRDANPPSLARSAPRGRGRFEVGTLCLLLSVASASGGQRALPATDTMPRTREAWRAETERPWRKGTFKEAFPEKASLMDAMLARTRELSLRFTHDTLVYDEGLAADLVEELYFDQKDPLLNRAWQQIVVDHISDVARWPEDRLPLAARQRLTDGLIEYADAGGGRYIPPQEAEVAEALDRLAPDDPRAQALVQALLLDALAWAGAIDVDVMTRGVYRVAEQYWGDSFVLRAHEARVPLEVPADRRPARYKEAVTALEVLLADASLRRGELPRKLATATDLALRDVGEESLNADLTARLLLVYERLLARRPMVPERVCDYIDRRLFRLAAHSDRLKTDEHWRLWAQAVGELGRQRISKALKNHVRGLLEKKELPEARRKAFEPLKALVSE